MEKIEEILLRAEKDFPEKFKNMITCRKSEKHEWATCKSNDIRFIDVECKNCKTNLAISMRFFAGTQDHG